jgi:hypothetical protein
MGICNATLPFLYSDISFTWIKDKPPPTAAKMRSILLENDSLPLLVQQTHLQSQNERLAIAVRYRVYELKHGVENLFVL